MVEDKLNLETQIIQILEGSYIYGEVLFKNIEDIWIDYEIIQRELLEHDRLLIDKPQIVVLNKLDCLDADQVMNIQTFFSKRLPKVEIQAISAVAKTNVDNLNSIIVKQLELKWQEANTGWPLSLKCLWWHSYLEWQVF